MRTYDKYKDSGIQWIGEIPEHWATKSFRNCINVLTDFTANGSFASLAENVEYLENGYSRLVRLTDIRVNFENDGVFINEKAHNFLKKSELFGDELLLANVGAYAGLVCLMPVTGQKMTLGPNMFLIRTNSHNKFTFHSLSSYGCNEQLKLMAISSAQPKLNKDNIKELKIVVPPLSEQTAIANYLDSKTTEIEQVVADKEALVCLYEEEKKALINEAVTKGLNPYAKLKPSEIDWLRNVPEHWEVKKLFYLFDRISSGTTPKSDEESYYLDGEINWLNTGDLNNSRITETSKKITQKAFENHSALKVYPIGSIVIAMYGATIGKLGILDIETTTNQACCVLSDIKNSNTLYVFNCLISGQDALINLSYGGGQPNISQDTLRNFRIPVPPLSEQTAIVQYIESETANINDKINQIKQEIDLLKEYRQALIFEAVTGKVRVD